MHPQPLHQFSAMTFHCFNAELELVGYVAGAIPPSDGAFRGMETFMPDFLSLFAGGHSVAKASEALEPDP